MAEVSFNATPEEYALVDRIVERAVEMNQSFDRLSLAMDLIAVNANGCPLDFAKLLAFQRFDFSHDIVGIVGNIDRSTGILGNCFLPRSAR